MKAFGDSATIDKNQIRERSDEKSKRINNISPNKNKLLQSGLSTLKRIQSFDFEELQSSKEKETIIPTSSHGLNKPPLADSQLFAAKLKQFQDFFQ